VTNAFAGTNQGGDSDALTWFDFDNDGDLDVAMPKYGTNQLALRNDGNNVFTKLNLSGTAYNNYGIAAGDYNNDGCVDLAFSAWAPHNMQLQRNNCNGTLTDLGYQFTGVGYYVWTPAWGDYDNDGLLDIMFGKLSSQPTSILIRNLGNNNWANVSGTAGFNAIGGDTYGVAWGDYDNDGYLDMAMANDGGGTDNWLWRNNANGTFTRTTLLNGTGAGHRQIVWGDYDNDGRLDLVTDNDGATNNALLLLHNETTGFAKIAVTVPNSYVRAMSWGDFDGDGDLDLSLATDSGSPLDPLILRNDS